MNNPAIYSSLPFIFFPNLIFMSYRYTLSFCLAFFVAGLFSPIHSSAQCGDTIRGLFVVNTFPYKEDFENGPAGWLTAPVDSLFPPTAPTVIANTPRPNTWAFGDPNKRQITGAASGDSCWTTGGLGTGPYGQLERSFVASPYFDMTNLVDPFVGMQVAWSSSSDDVGYLEVTVDSGKTWTLIGSIGTGSNWYNDTYGGSIPLCRLPGVGWGGNSSMSSGGWIPAFQDIAYLSGKSSVQFRMFFASNAFGQNQDGIAFDDFVIGEKFEVDFGADTTLCFGNVLQLDLGAKPKARYSWYVNGILSPLSTTHTFRVATNPSAPAAVYIGCVTDSLGYTACDTIVVSFSQTQLGHNPPATILCPGDSVNFNSGFNPNAIANWYAFDSTCLCYNFHLTGPNLTVKTAGTFLVVLTDNLGCVERDTVSVQVEIPPITYIGGDDTVCVGTAKLLSAPTGPPGTKYNWTLNNTKHAETQTVSATAPGKYKVIVTTPAGCSEQDSMNLLVVLAPVVQLDDDYTTCDSVLLDANNAGADFLWHNSQTTQTQTLYPPFTAWVEVTNANDCVARDTIHVILGTNPPVNLGEDQVICDGASVTLDAGPQVPSVIYNWSNGPPNTQTKVVSQPGFYFVTVIDTNTRGCQAADSINVTTSNLRIDLGPDTVVCAGRSIVLDATALGQATYQWNTSATTPTITVTSGGTYSCVLRDTLGCVVMDDVFVAQGPVFNGNFSISPDTFVVFNAVPKTHTFTAVNFPTGTNSFHWDFGDGHTATGQTVQHDYASLDTFTVCLILSDGQCSDTVCGLAGNYLRFTGLEEEMGLTLDIFPNPSEGQFQVEMEFQRLTSVSLMLYDLKGRVVVDKKLGQLSTHREMLDLSQAAKGIYLLRLETERGIVYRKLVLR